MGQGPTFFFIFIVFVTPFMRYLYLVNKHQAWEHTSGRTTSWHWSSVILFQHNKRGWNGMIFFFFEGMTSCDRNMGLKENRKRERVKMTKGARDDRKWGRGLFLLDCFWKLQMFPQLYRGKNLPQRFFLVWEEKRREEASLPLYFRKLRQNVCYVMEISSSPAHVSPSTDLLP